MAGVPDLSPAKPPSPASPSDRSSSGSARGTRSSAPITATNSNTRVAAGRLAQTHKPASPRVEPPTRTTNSNARLLTPGAKAAAQPVVPATDNTDMRLARTREAMVARLRKGGIVDEMVLQAMMSVPRHHFVDEALASRAYEDGALPIGHGQTISQPWIVARMIETARARRNLGRVLEVGTGCGYQAAVLAGVANEVYSIERIRALHEYARTRLRPLRLNQVRLALGDGMLGMPGAAPFDAIVVAAAGLEIPVALSEQLAVGGRLVAPEGGTEQRLILIERTGARTWKRSELEAVRFVPLRSGVIW